MSKDRSSSKSNSPSTTPSSSRRSSQVDSPSASPSNRVDNSNQSPRRQSISGSEKLIFRSTIEKLSGTQKFIETRLEKQAKKHFPSLTATELEWQPIWGKKITSNAATNEGDGMINLGLVIGKTLVIPPSILGRKSPAEQKLINENSSYRFDWDIPKGKHVNTFEVPDLEPLTPDEKR
jgi:hypothetical protein